MLIETSYILIGIVILLTGFAFIYLIIQRPISPPNQEEELYLMYQNTKEYVDQFEIEECNDKMEFKYKDREEFYPISGNSKLRHLPVIEEVENEHVYQSSISETSSGENDRSLPLYSSNESIMINEECLSQSNAYYFNKQSGMFCVSLDDDILDAFNEYSPSENMFTTDFDILVFNLCYSATLKLLSENDVLFNCFVCECRDLEVYLRISLYTKYKKNDLSRYIREKIYQLIEKIPNLYCLKERMFHYQEVEDSSKFKIGLNGKKISNEINLFKKHLEKLINVKVNRQKPRNETNLRKKELFNISRCMMKCYEKLASYMLVCIREENNSKNDMMYKRDVKRIEKRSRSFN